MFLLLVAAASIQSQGIDLEIPAAPLPNVLAEISRQSGRAYEARGEVSKEVLAIRVHGVQTEDLLPRIAQVVGGEWRTSGDRTILIASPSFERQEQEAERAEKRQNITLALKQYRQEMDRQPVFDDAAAKGLLRKLTAANGDAQNVDSNKYADVVAGQSGTPEHRLLIDLLSLVPVSELDSLADGARVVYSDTPNRMQRALPAGSRDAVDKFVRSLLVWRNAIATSGRLGDTMPIPESFEGGKIDLIVEDWEDGTGLNAQLLVFSPTGQIVCNAWARLFGTFDFADKEPKPADSGKEWSQTLDEGDEARELRRLVVRDLRHDTDDEASRQPLLAKWRDRMEEPNRFEPLSFIPGKLWVSMSLALGDNLVANVSEFSLSPYLDRVDPVTPQTVMHQLDGYYRTERSDGWLMIRPYYVLQARRDRIDRAAAGSLLRRSLQAGGLLIEDVADYMARPETHNGLLEWDGGYLSAFFRGTGPNSIVRTMGARDEMKLYGLLTPQQRRLLRERPIALGALSADARAHLEKLVYWNSWLSDSGDREPTELLPNGIPNDGQLRLIEDRRETLVQPYTESGRIVLRNLAPRTAARLGQAQGQSTTSAEANSWNRFRIRIGHTLKFRVDFTPTVSEEFELYELLDPRLAPMTYSQLPAEFRAAAEEARRAAQQKPNPPTNVAPPPAS